MKFIETYNHRNEVGVLLEIELKGEASNTCELSEIAHDLLLHIAGCAPDGVQSLLSQGFIKDPDMSVSQWLTQKGKPGIQINRFVRYSCANT